MGKTVFIDFDGTLADRGVTPTEHLRVIRAAQARGHRVMVCTGRPKSLMHEADLAPLDGLVGSAGGYVEIHGRVLDDRRFSPDLARRTVELLDAHDVAYILEAPEGIYSPSGMRTRLRELLSLGSAEAASPDKTVEDILGALKTTDDPASRSFGKITCFDSTVPLALLVDRLLPEVGLIPSSIQALGDRAGELFLSEVNKAVGIATMAEYLGLDRSQIIAIGDGHNDIEMLEYAQTAVAVDGAPEELLALADLIIPGPADHGLVEGFVRLGLIDS